MELTNTITSSQDGRVTFTFINTESYKQFNNIIQAYGILFNEKGEVLLGKRKWDDEFPYLLPGGTIEEGETPEQTLHREAMEEVDVEIENMVLLGAQHCEFIDTPERLPMIQLRYCATIKKVHSSTPDPDQGNIWERVFVKPEKMNDLLQWGPIGDHLAKRAKEWYLKHNF